MAKPPRPPEPIATISINNWQATMGQSKANALQSVCFTSAHNVRQCPIEQSRLIMQLLGLMNRVITVSILLTTSLTMEPTVASTLLLCYVCSCRLGKTIFEFDTRILLSNITVEYLNITVTYEACDVCMNFVPSYLLLIS